MGIRAEHDRSRHVEENGIYAEAVEWKAVELALDSYFREVIDGNLPLTGEESWWRRQVIPERVNRFNRNWCILFTALAMFRDRVSDNIPSLVRVDGNLVWQAQCGRSDDWVRLNWED